MTSSSASSSAVSCFFNEPAELAYLSSCEYYHDPFFFPENKVVPINRTETVFNTSTLTFEEIQPDDDECALFMCNEVDPDSRVKYITSSCGCKSFICKSCLLQNLEQNNNFNACPFCRNRNFCPRLVRQSITITDGYTTQPITELIIHKYRKELQILENLKINGDYCRNNILDKDFKTLTAYERYYWNIHYAFVSDICGDEYTDIEGANNFYIDRGTYYNGVPSIDDFNTPNTTADLVSSRTTIVVRNHSSKSYDSYDLNFMTENDIATSIADQIGEYPFCVCSSFIFEYCITKDFKNALGNSENNDLWVNILGDNDNEDFLRNMLRPNAEIVDAVKLHYLNQSWGNDDIEEILGYKMIIETNIKHLINGEESNQFLWLCVGDATFLW